MKTGQVYSDDGQRNKIFLKSLSLLLRTTVQVKKLGDFLFYSIPLGAVEDRPSKSTNKN